MATDSNRPEHQAPDEQPRQEQQDAEVSELMDPAPEPGGADATDKSTDTAPSEADQPST